MGPQLNITHVVLSLDAGGMERVVLSLAREGVARGQVVRVVCLERPGVLAPQFAALGVEVECLDKRPGLRFEVARRLKRLWQAAPPDVVHTHQIGALFYAGRAARRAGVPVVVHTEHGKHFANWRARWLGWFAARAAD